MKMTTLEKKLLLIAIALVVISSNFSASTPPHAVDLTKSIEQPLPGPSVSKEVYPERLVQVIFTHD